MSQAKKKLREDNRIDNWAYLWMAMFTAAGFLLFHILYSFFGAFVLKIISALIIILLIGGLLYSKWKKSDSERKTIYVILFTSIILRLCYVLITSGAPMSGADYELFTDVKTNLTLPETFQPLYYIAAAFVYNTMAMFGFTQPYALDIVRVCTEYMGIVASIAVYYILCEIEANDTAVYLGTAIVAFHPGLIRLGGEISPLAPMIAVMCLAIVFLTRWNNFTDGFDFIFMSVTFGLAVMLHMSALIFLPVIAVLVIINLVRVIKRKNAANIISSAVQTLGGVGAWAVLSFAYPVRNLMSGKNTGILQLFGNYEGTIDFKTKFLSFSMKELMEVFVSPKDTNAWVYLVKSSVSKKKVNIWTLITMSVCAAGYYILQNFGSDRAETMDFRVAPIILVLGVIMLCNGIKVLNVKKKLSFVSQIFYLITVLICLAFCIGCVAYGCWFV